MEIISGGNFYGDIQYTLTPKTLTLTSTEGVNNFYGTAAFNGIVLTDLGGANPIIGATVDPSSIDPSAVVITVTGGNVYLNFEGSAFDTDIVQTFDFTLAGANATPEPSSFVLLGTGAFALVGAARRKFRKA